MVGYVLRHPARIRTGRTMAAGKSWRREGAHWPQGLAAQHVQSGQKIAWVGGEGVGTRRRWPMADAREGVGGQEGKGRVCELAGCHRAAVLGRPLAIRHHGVHTRGLAHPAAAVVLRARRGRGELAPEACGAAGASVRMVPAARCFGRLRLSGGREKGQRSAQHTAPRSRANRCHQNQVQCKTDARHHRVPFPISSASRPVSLPARGSTSVGCNRRATPSPRRIPSSGGRVARPSHAPKRSPGRLLRSSRPARAARAQASQCLVLLPGRS
jgi:hypothetical protein